jgi:glycosyl transferase family 25
MRSYVINLARSPDRRAYMSSQLKALGCDYEIVEAVDGQGVDTADPNLVGPVLVSDGRHLASIAGCALSHLKVYNKIIHDGHEAALVLEDDVVLPSDLGTLTESIGAHLSGAEIVLLGFVSFRSSRAGKPLRLTRAGAIDLPSSRLLVRPADVDDLDSAFAYVITREACERLSRAVLPVRAVADAWGFYVREGALESVRCLVPIAAVPAAQFRTTIGDYSPKSLQNRLRVIASRAPVIGHALATRRKRMREHLERYVLVD